MMINVREVAILAVVASLGASGAAHAQALANSKGPVNTPPDTYGGVQFVDNDGCVYVRSGYAGRVTWVPRVDRKRRQLCDDSFTPTFGEAKVANAKTGGGLFAKKPKTAELETMPEPVEAPAEDVTIAKAEETPKAKKPLKGLFAKRTKPVVAEEKVTVAATEPAVEPAKEMAAAPAPEAKPKTRKPLFGLSKKTNTVGEMAKVSTPDPKPVAEVTAPVETVAKVEKPIKKIATLKPVKATPFKKGYYVRVASFGDEGKADEVLQWFKTSGHRGILAPNGDETQVNVGPFSSAGAAKAAVYQAVGAGYKSAKIVKH